MGPQTGPAKRNPTQVCLCSLRVHVLQDSLQLSCTLCVHPCSVCSSDAFQTGIQSKAYFDKMETVKVFDELDRRKIMMKLGASKYDTSRNLKTVALSQNQQLSKPTERCQALGTLLSAASFYSVLGHFDENYCCSSSCTNLIRP
jgi:hypothetical protein